MPPISADSLLQPTMLRHIAGLVASPLERDNLEVGEGKSSPFAFPLSTSRSGGATPLDHHYSNLLAKTDCRGNDAA